MKRSWIGVSLLAALVTCAAPAHADQRYFTYAYDWYTPAKGEKEVELLWTQAEGGNAEAEFNFEYGVTDRWLVAPYLLAHREHGDEWEVDGWKLEQRYRFGDFHTNRFMPAVYFEVKKENGEDWAAAGKLITTYVSNHDWLWSANLNVGSSAEDSTDVEVGYASGISFKLNEHVRAGAEFFGDWSPHQEHFLGPTATYLFDESTRLLATVGFRYAGESGGAVRLMFEKEWR